MNKFDILLIEFPFTNSRHKKLRPAVVVTDKKGSNVVVCQITTKKRTILDFEVELLKENTCGNITFDSYIYVDMIFTLHESLVVKNIGSVTSNLVKTNIKNKLQLLFAL